MKDLVSDDKDGDLQSNPKAVSLAHSMHNYTVM